MASESTGVTMQIFINTLKGKTITLDVNPNNTIQSVLNQIENKEGKPMDHSFLMFGGKQLENNHTVKYYNIQKETTLHLITKLKGPMTINVTTITGNVMTIKLVSSDTIQTLKAHINIIKNSFYPRYELVCNNQIIDQNEDCPLFKTCLQDGCMINIRNIYCASYNNGMYGSYRLPHLIKVSIRQLHTKPFLELVIDANDTVQKVKDQIVDKDYKMKDYMLMYNGKTLQMWHTVSHYKIKYGADLVLKQRYKYISKKQGKVYSKHGTSGKSKPDLILRLTHLNETISLFKINFNMSFNKFLDIYVRKYLLDLISNFDYFINSIDENKNISYTNNSLLSSKCKSGDVLIVRLRQNVPLPAKPDDDNDDAEIIPKMKTVNFNNNGNVTKTEIIQNKKEIKETIANKLLNIKASNKKLSKLMDIESFDNDNDEIKNNDDEKNKQDLKLDYKLHLDLDFEQEMKDKDTFYKNMKTEIAASLNVDINSIHINSVHSGSVILLISIDEKGTTQIYKDNILESSQFEDWSINKCIKGKNLNNYYSNKSKNLNEQNPMWIFLKNRFPGSYNVMKSGSLNKYESMKNTHSNLIEPLSFNQIAAIYLYTTNYLYKALNKSLRDGTSEFADYAVELISGINKLPMVWTKTYRGLGSNFTKYHSYIPNVYKKGNVVRWDGMNSTSLNEQTALNFSDKWVLEIEGYHGRDIQPFSAIPSEDELIYLMSSHFFVTNTYNKGNKLYFKCREMPFPWNNKAILWVDDRPNNNKSLMERLEKKGIMTIPRISTYDAMQFIQYMEKIFLNNNNSFNKFRIISDMSRYERENEQDENSQTVKNRSAGAILVDKLRKKGYNQQICIYTGNEKRAIDECKNLGHETNIKATVSTQECFKFADY